MKAIRTILGLSILFFAATGFGQGSLTPPGAPESMMKTLEQIEPRTPISDGGTVIAESGSYYLTGNIIVTNAGQDGITVNADDVTIDLNGFAVIGPGANSGHGIYQASIYRNLAVCNGKAVGWRGSDDTSGIFADGASVVLSGLQVSTNRHGITTGAGATITDCTAFDNVANGIVAGESSTLSDCTARNNGYYGIYSLFYSTLQNCGAYGNDNFGIYTDSGNTINGCSASYNDGGGIFAGSGSTVLGSSATRNGSTGIGAGYGCTISSCSSYDNDGDGINVFTASLVSDCSVYQNDDDGIEVPSFCIVVGNTSSFNGRNGDGAGIHVTSKGNRIDGNNVALNDQGIDVDDIRNFIVRNTAYGNTTNWTVVASNACFVINATLSTNAITGDSGGIGPGSDNPNANFSF